MLQQYDNSILERNMAWEKVIQSIISGGLLFCLHPNTLLYSKPTVQGNIGNKLQIVEDIFKINNNLALDDRNFFIDKGTDSSKPSVVNETYSSDNIHINSNDAEKRKNSSDSNIQNKILKFSEVEVDNCDKHAHIDQPEEKLTTSLGVLSTDISYFGKFITSSYRKYNASNEIVKNSSLVLYLDLTIYKSCHRILIPSTGEITEYILFHVKVIQNHSLIYIYAYDPICCKLFEGIIYVNYHFLIVSSFLIFGNDENIIKYSKY